MKAAPVAGSSQIHKISVWSYEPALMAKRTSNPAVYARPSDMRTIPNARFALSYEDNPLGVSFDPAATDHRLTPTLAWLKKVERRTLLTRW